MGTLKLKAGLALAGLLLKVLYWWYTTRLKVKLEHSEHVAEVASKELAAFRAAVREWNNIDKELEADIHETNDENIGDKLNSLNAPNSVPDDKNSGT